MSFHDGLYTASLALFLMIYVTSTYWLGPLSLLSSGRINNITYIVHPVETEWELNQHFHIEHLEYDRQKVVNSGQMLSDAFYPSICMELSYPIVDDFEVFWAAFARNENITTEMRQDLALHLHSGNCSKVHMRGNIQPLKC